MDKRVYREPIKRSKLRLYLGKRYYTIRTYLKWYLNRGSLAKHISASSLSYLFFTHKTPLVRKLQGVDLQLQYNKVNNLRIAADKINGLCIKPGEVFSYWRLIGKPSRGKGYLEGLILNPDGSFAAGIGGGLCQLSNLIYWMTLHTPLKVIERYRHSHDIFPDSNRTQPFGSGATCVYNYLDLQIVNNTDEEYQLCVSLSEDCLIGEWRCSKPISYRYEVYEKDHFITSTHWGGYVRNNSIYRRVYEDEKLVRDEFVAENHALMMYHPLLGHGDTNN